MNYAIRKRTFMHSIGFKMKSTFLANCDGGRTDGTVLPALSYREIDDEFTSSTPDRWQ